MFMDISTILGIVSVIIGIIAIVITLLVKQNVLKINNSKTIKVIQSSDVNISNNNFGVNNENDRKD